MAHLDFIEDLLDDPWSALSSICDKFDKLEIAARIDGDPWNLEYFHAFIDFFVLVKAVITNNDLKITMKTPAIAPFLAKNMTNIANYFEGLKQEVVKQQIENQMIESTEAINIRLGAGFYYEFSDDDISQIQNLINELRDLIAKSDVLEEDHKRRLLNRLERLQSELHKKLSDLDRFWGLVGDAGVMAGKFGEDVKPIIDRIMELGKIIWGAQAKAEELPPATEFPLLTKEDDN